MKRILIFCYILVSAAAVSANCNMNCLVNGTEVKHIACGHDGKFGPLCPNNARVINITETQKNHLLHKINVERNFVAGGANATYDYKPACRMATVQWDDELAKHALLNVKRCFQWFDHCHPTDTIRKSGQFSMRHFLFVDDSPNIAIKVVLRQMVERTYAKTYSDLLSDRNTRIGCAITSAPSSKTFSKKHVNEFWSVCNFSTDIHDRESMYEICESAGEKCKTTPVGAYPNLCAVDETYE